MCEATAHLGRCNVEAILILLCHIHRFFPLTLDLSIFLIAFQFASVVLILTYVVWQWMTVESVFSFCALK